MAVDAGGRLARWISPGRLAVLGGIAVVTSLALLWFQMQLASRAALTAGCPGLAAGPDAMATPQVSSPILPPVVICSQGEAGSIVSWASPSMIVITLAGLLFISAAVVLARRVWRFLR